MGEMTGRSPRLWKEGAGKDALGWDFEGARRFQALLGLKLTPAERLSWLEEAVAEMREICGSVQQGRPIARERSRKR